MNSLIKKAALITPDGFYRYTLTRTWDDKKPALLAIGLNPSVADADIDDPTINREIAFAMAWGYGALLKGNLFAYRATDPAVMKDAAEAGGINVVGKDNDKWLGLMAGGAKTILVAWGVHGVYMGRDKEVARLLEPAALVCLGTTKGGHPRHPLYVRADTIPVPWACP